MMLCNFFCLFHYVFVVSILLLRIIAPLLGLLTGIKQKYIYFLSQQCYHFLAGCSVVILHSNKTLQKEMGRDFSPGIPTFRQKIPITSKLVICCCPANVQQWSQKSKLFFTWLTYMLIKTFNKKNPHNNQKDVIKFKNRVLKCSMF